MRLQARLDEIQDGRNQAQPRKPPEELDAHPEQAAPPPRCPLPSQEAAAHAPMCIGLGLGSDDSDVDPGGAEDGDGSVNGVVGGRPDAQAYVARALTGDQDMVADHVDEQARVGEYPGAGVLWGGRVYRVLGDEG